MAVDYLLLTQLDLDLGNYERFLEIKLTHDNNISTGMIYQDVINRERLVVPHITDAIQDWIKCVAHIPVDGKLGPAEHQYWSFGLGLNLWGSLDFLKAVCFKRVCYCAYLSHSRGKTLHFITVEEGLIFKFEPSMFV